ncbi:uncharacterized protein LOC123520225 isoform X2 [Portunus trituberculatus]|uniref:uncharacterized protein LOC123520225 isoform X2 n=1 Tax=Portunus trituberculatus TaxID=210409 RepID=UPI001E1D0059|nr:uncharacterized protein LOC123520225 isoform X2 [Portunus trituberculatus]
MDARIQALEISHSPTNSEVVTITVNEEAVEVPNVTTPAAEPIPKQAGSMDPVTSRGKWSTRKLLYDHDWIEDTDMKLGEMSKYRHEHFLQKREKLLDLQIKHMETQLEEATIRREIVRKELEKISKQA